MSIQILKTALHNSSLKQELTECFIADVINQLEVLDPADDGDELLEILEELSDEPDTKTVSRLFSFLLGTSLDEWLEEVSANND